MYILQPSGQFGGLISKEAADSPITSRKLADLSLGIVQYPEIHISVPETLTSSSSVNSMASSGSSSSTRALNNLRSEFSQVISNIKKPGKS